LRRAIRGDQRRRRFVAPHEDLEESLGGGGAELLHPKIFEDEQVDSRELLRELAAHPRRVGLCEVGCEIERAADARAVAGANRADGKRGRDMRFPHTGGGGTSFVGLRGSHSAGSRVRSRRCYVQGSLESST
jgi:hypothetical protein